MRWFRIPPKFSHTELVHRAVHWLRFTMHCRAVLAECGSTFEIPDAIGWRRAVQSILVECKTTRSDFFADRSKSFRRNPDQGMGMARYMMTAPKLVRPYELPIGWGLLEVHATCVRVVRDSDRFVLAPRAERSERHLLMAELGFYQAAFEPGFRMPLAAGDQSPGFTDRLHEACNAPLR